MLKMFPVDVPSHDIVECVPERAFFAEVHRSLHTISLSGSIKIHFVLLQRSSLWAPIILPCWTWYVEYFNMRLQSSLACSEWAVWTVEQNFALKDFPVYIAEVILVAWVVFGRKGALCAAKWLWSVFLCFRVWWIPCADIKALSPLYKLIIRAKLFEFLCCLLAELQSNISKCFFHLFPGSPDSCKVIYWELIHLSLWCMWRLASHKEPHCMNV